jgi:hypothetical protein
MKTKKAFKWWWGYNPSKIEDFLEQKAIQGWRLTNVSFAMTNFKFEYGEPQKVRFAMDFNSKPNDEYLTIAKDAGWEWVGKSSGWIMWQKAYQNERPALFTDSQSIIDRNKRLLQFLSILVMMQIPILTMDLIDRVNTDHFITSTLILCLYLPILAFLLYGIIRLFLANRALKKDGRR